MSWKTFLFFALICTVANSFQLSAREPSFIKPSSTPPLIVNENDDQKYDVYDKFIVKQRDDEGHNESLRSLFPRVSEATTTNQRPGLVQKLVESKKATKRQASTKPKLTVVVGSEPAPKGSADEVVSEDPVKTPAASKHHYRHHHHYHHDHHAVRHNHHAHRHHDRHQSGTKKRRYGRMATRRIQ